MCVGAGPALCTRVPRARGPDRFPRAAPTGFSGRTGLTEGTAQLPPQLPPPCLSTFARFLHPSWTIHILKKPPHQPVGTVPTPSGSLSRSVLVTGSDGATHPTEPCGPRSPPSIGFSPPRFLSSFLRLRLPCYLEESCVTWRKGPRNWSRGDPQQGAPWSCFADSGRQTCAEYADTAEDRLPWRGGILPDPGSVPAHRNKYFIAKRANEKIPALALLPRTSVDSEVHSFYLRKQLSSSIFFSFFPLFFFFPFPPCRHAESHSGYVCHIIICQLRCCSLRQGLACLFCSCETGTPQKRQENTYRSVIRFCPWFLHLLPSRSSQRLNS